MVSLFPADNPTDRVYGVAYEIRDDLWQQSVEGQLDHREKGGYSQRKVVFHASDDGDELSEVVTVYIGKKDDPQYAGPDDLEVMAEKKVKEAEEKAKMEEADHSRRLALAAMLMGTGERFFKKTYAYGYTG